MFSHWSLKTEKLTDILTQLHSNNRLKINATYYDLDTRESISFRAANYRIIKNEIHLYLTNDERRRLVKKYS